MRGHMVHRLFDVPYALLLLEYIYFTISLYILNSSATHSLSVIFVENP